MSQPKNVVRAILIGTLLLFLSQYARAQSSNSSVEFGKDRSECKDLKIEYELIKQGENSFKLEIKPSGGTRPYNYIFMDKGNNVLSHDNSKKEFDNLKQGTYRCIVADTKHCSKELYIEIK